MKKVTKKWVDFAKEDLKDAEILLKNKSYKGCSWHCHQSVEKILKAIVIERGKRPKKVHDLIELNEEARVKLPQDLEKFLEELNFHYLPPRYPDFYEQTKRLYRPKNIKRILKLTQVLFKWLRNQLNQLG